MAPREVIEAVRTFAVAMANRVAALRTDAEGVKDDSKRDVLLGKAAVLTGHARGLHNLLDELELEVDEVLVEKVCSEVNQLGVPSRPKGWDGELVLKDEGEGEGLYIPSDDGACLGKPLISVEDVYTDPAREFLIELARRWNAEPSLLVQLEGAEKRASYFCKGRNQAENSLSVMREARDFVLKENERLLAINREGAASWQQLRDENTKLREEIAKLRADMDKLVVNEFLAGKTEVVFP